MAENTEELAQAQPGTDEQAVLNEDLFDFPSDENFAAEIRLANELDDGPSDAPDGGLDATQDDDIFDFAGHDAILESEGDLGDLSSGTQILESFVEADEALDDPLASVEPASEPQASAAPTPSAPIDSGPPAIGTSDLDEDLFSFNNPIDPDTSEPAQPLQHEDLIAKRETVAEVVEQPAPLAQPTAQPIAQHAAAAPSTATPTASGLPPVSEVARQSANEALAVAQAARLAILAQQPAATAPVADTGWNRRMVISIAAAFLLVNASLIFIAGRLSRSLNSALNGVREDLTRSISVAQQADGNARTFSTGGQAPELVPAGTSGPTVLTDVASRELELAHKEIEEGEFPEARRRLYRLLANRDRLIITADVLAESEFLVAESYFAEAKRLDTIVVEAEQ
ncbi:MAG: hypothetical protein ACI8QZ_000030 [Chlamydiales bacterium]|jgi:hypothetical protein